MERRKKKRINYLRRKKRVRWKINGTKQRPRLSVSRSLKHIYAQIIDDENGTTLVHASSLSPELKTKTDNGGKLQTAQNVGQLIAQKAKAHQIETVIFDRGGYLYHGRVKALADAARKEGLKF